MSVLSEGWPCFPSDGPKKASGNRAILGSIIVKIKLNKSAVEPAQSHVQAVELLDALVPGVHYKVAPTGRKVFMLQYRANAVERCTSWACSGS